MIWVIIILLSALVITIGWIAYQKPVSSIGLSGDEKRMAASFDAKKASTKMESDDQLQNDLDNDIIR